MSKTGIPFLFDHLKDAKTQEYQTDPITDRYSAITHYVGKRLEAEKAVRGGNRGNQYTEMPKPQNGDLPKFKSTSQRIAAEIGKSKNYVERAEKFAKGLDAANVLCTSAE